MGRPSTVVLLTLTCPTCGKVFERYPCMVKSRAYCSLRCYSNREDALADRVWSKIDRRGPDECWPWTGAAARNGYGHLRFRKKEMVATRALWEVIHGEPPPADRQICHHCDNPPCMNPAHWFLGTRLENMADMRAKGRSNPAGHAMPGEKNPRAILTLSEAREILARYRAGGISQEALGDEYGIHQTIVSKVVRGVHWTSSNN